MHKFNFNANDIMGNLDVDLTPKCPQRDINKRRINKFNFLCSENGHVINRNKRKILDKAYLEKNGDFPMLLNFKCKKFHIKDVTGLLLRDVQTGEPVMKKDKFNSKYWDRKGRQVNKRGYLIDMEGNIVTNKNNKIFDVKALLKDGEIPKIFSFTKFNQNEVTGQFEVDPLGQPILKQSKNQKNVLFDDNGKQVNKMGFLTNDDGDIVNHKGKRVFKRAILEDNFVNIPEVFRQGRGLVRTDSQDSFQKAMDEVENIAGD